ncbi:MAG TPA: ATP-binding protein [Microthrixaceae bacterium]|nr:ATP-binding protein [Microthrixaceae bacterium]
MSLRIKLVLALVVLSAAAATVVGAFSYRTTADELNTQIDASLESTAQQLLGRPQLDEEFRHSRRTPINRSLRNFRAPGDVAVQIIGPRGMTASIAEQELPVDPTDQRIAAGTQASQEIRDIKIDGTRYRMLTSGLGEGRGAVQVARSLAETDAVLGALRSRILTVAMAAAAVAAIIGWFLARQMTERLVRLTAAAESVATTRDTALQVPVSGSDETARLGLAFNDMLLALSSAREDQRRLVQDAGHELRTPLTSLRTNVFALEHSENVSDEQRRRILEDLQGETAELTTLINEIVELATDRHGDEATTAVELGTVIEQVVVRAAQRSGRQIRASADGSLAAVRRSAIIRAIGNLIENAIKFDPSDSPIDVSCRNGMVTVSDRGPGLADQDVAHVFERFYRAEESRSQPGSGLGLAIVADVVAQHHGTVFAHNRDGGGAVVGFTLPTLATLDQNDELSQ